MASAFHYLAGSIWRAPWPWNSYFFTPDDRFRDLINSVNKTIHLDPYHEQSAGVAAYFPFTYAVLALLRNVSLNIYVPGFVLLSLVAACGYSIMLARRYGGDNVVLRRLLFMLLFVIVICSYPFQFAVDRGNFDIIVAFLCFACVFLLDKNKFLPAVLFLSIAIALKGYPAIFLLFFVERRKYLYALLAAGLSIVLTGGSCLILSRGFYWNWSGFLHGLSEFHRLYVVETWSMHYSSDLYNALRILSKIKPGLASAIAFMLKNYGLISFIVAMVCILYFLFAESSRRLRVVAFSGALLFYPNIINDYKLIFLLLPLVFLVFDDGKWTWREILCVSCVLGLLVPKHYYVLFNDVTISCILNPLFLCTMIGAILSDRESWKQGSKHAVAKMRWYLEPAIDLGRKFIGFKQ